MIQQFVLVEIEWEAIYFCRPCWCSLFTWGEGVKEPYEVEREVHKLLLGVKSVSCVRSGKYLPLSGLPRAEVKKFWVEWFSLICDA